MLYLAQKGQAFGLHSELQTECHLPPRRVAFDSIDLSVWIVLQWLKTQRSLNTVKLSIDINEGNWDFKTDIIILPFLRLK